MHAETECARGCKKNCKPTAPIANRKYRNHNMATNIPKFPASSCNSLLLEKTTFLSLTHSNESSIYGYSCSFHNLSPFSLISRLPLATMFIPRKNIPACCMTVPNMTSSLSGPSSISSKVRFNCVAVKSLRFMNSATVVPIVWSYYDRNTIFILRRRQACAHRSFLDAEWKKVFE